jgi:Na+-transporting NADH:ubiquinone oxidoreductase subunit A
MYTPTCFKEHKLAVFKIKKGFNLPLAGEASTDIENACRPQLVSVMTADFSFEKFRLLVQEGDKVKTGTPVLASKNNDSLVLVSPAAGEVHQIRRGERRKLLGVDISIQEQDSVSFETWDQAKIQGTSAKELSAFLMQTGIWPIIRQRPFSKIANPEVLPKAIFINAMATAPLAPAQDILCQGRTDLIQLAVDALRQFQPNVFFISDTKNATEFASLSGVNQHQFDGPHPAGLVSTHIGELSPLNKGETVWYVTAYQASLIGEVLQTGQFPASVLTALTGPLAHKAMLYKVPMGSQLGAIVGDAAGKRVVSGNALDGSNQGASGYLGFYDNQITVLQEGGERHYLFDDEHWSGLGLNSFSVHRLFAAALVKVGQKWNINTLKKGGERAIVQSNVYDRFVPLDIYPTFLVKACINKDIDRMEQLGIYEVDAEDFTLCTFACPSKVDAAQAIADGLAFIEKEG